MKKTVSLVTALLVIAGLIFMGYAEGASPAKPPIKVGLLISLTGAYAQTGERVLPAVKMAIEEINKKGGILGNRKIELMYEDDGGIPERAASNVRKYAEAGCEAIIGTPWSHLAIAANEVCYELKLPVIHSSAMAEKAATGQKSWCFNVTLDVAEQENSKNLINYAPKPFKTVFLVVENQDWARGAASKYERMWQGRTSDEPKIVAKEIVETNQTDFMSVLTKIKAASVDAILVSDTAAPAEAAFVKQTKEAGLPQMMLEKKKMLFFVQGTLNVDMLELSGWAANGILSSESFWPEMDLPSAQEFVQRYKDKTKGKVPDKITCYSYCAAHHILMAVEKAGSVDNYNAINNSILTYEWEAPQGHIRMDPQACRPIPKVYPVMAWDSKLILLRD
jgi:branched-chain amino acid transport system substrate-binding protein